MVTCTDKKIRILFTSVGRRVELIQAFRNAATELGVTLTIYGADITETAPALWFCDKHVKVCRIADKEYIPDLVDFCKKNEIDLLIPTIDTDLLLLSQNKEKFMENGTQVFISSEQMVKYCRDKRTTAELFQKCGLLAPESFGKVEKYDLSFPAFIKPLDGSSSINAYKVNNKEELQEYADKIGNYVIQPFVAGKEYTVDIFCDFNGKPVYITPRERMAVRSGEVLKTKIVNDTQIITECMQLIEVFKPCGPITVQLIRDSENRDYYIEINPRYGGGAPLSMKAGADSASATIKLLTDQTLDYQENAAVDGAIYSRYDQSICVTETKHYTVDSVVENTSIYENYEAVIFDLDDTLYDEKQYVQSGFQKIAREVLHNPALYDKLWTVFLEKKSAIDTVLYAENIYSSELKEKCLDVYRKQFPDITLHDGVEELLWTLRKKGKKLGIITDGRIDGQKRKLQKLNLYSLVDEVIITDELAGNGNVFNFRKPNTIAFEIMKTRLGVPYSRMIYIGDNPKKDFTAPEKLGMAWCYVKNPNGLYGEK